MLKGIDPLLGPELLNMLARAGHGDVVALVDRNYPAYSPGAPVVRVDGVDCTTLVRAMLTVFPIDGFIPDPVHAMEPVNGPPPRSHQELKNLLHQHEQRDVSIELLEREAFYAAAANAVGIIATTDDRPYSCFLLTKGVV